ncbi:MAG TPA: GNAT family N-acetyltransferase [Casimicrobiaceae bacterium]|nr:GNAT family N-acetyltransferase [Casimicrobiaceae bacterium]
MGEPRGFSIRLCAWAQDAPALRRVRHDVFVVEQEIPESLEWDAADATSLHALAEDDAGAPIGCGRLLVDGHVGRLAVIRAWRRRGVGAALLGRLVDEARRRGHARVVLNAQTQAMPFYARHGFQASGSAFEEAGIPHREMSRTLA